MYIDLGVPANITGIWHFLYFMKQWFKAWIILCPVFVLMGIGPALILYPWYLLATHNFSDKKDEEN